MTTNIIIHPDAHTAVRADLLDVPRANELTVVRSIPKDLNTLTAKDLIGLTLSELEKMCALIMDTVADRQAVRPSASEMPERELVCPHCGSIHCVKNGSVRGKRRFVCRDCKKSFGTNHNSVLMFSNLSPKIWKAYVGCMVNGKTLEVSAQIVGVCLKTSFYMRHKILDALACIERDTVGGIVEMDETFLHESFKGNHKKSGFVMPRRAHKRGNAVSTRGLSKEQVSIGTALDRSDNLIMNMAGFGRVSYAQLERIFDGHVRKGSTLWTDSLGGYKKLSKKLEARHEAIPSGEYTKGEVNLAHINALHSRFKKWLDRFHGVSTKHLGNYLAWFLWLEGAKGLKESAKAGQMWQDVLNEMADTKIETIRFRVPAFV